MNILVRVNGARAAQSQMAAIQSSTRTLQATTTAASAASLGMGAGLRSMTHGLERYGKNMQWVGRQIEYNFTLPIALATGLTAKWAMENERAMTRLKKVYGGTSMPTQQFAEETEALGRAFRFLSDNYGTALDEVIDAGATWAQAGAENIAVANGVRASLELQVLGEMELVESTEALIAIQAQYGLSSDQLRQTIADLNAVENETSVRMSDLVQAMQRGAGVAREAGVSHREYAAMVASMVPAAANANQAGNSLKTIITRVMAPTRQATEAMQGLGIATQESAWQSANYTERMHTLADALDEVSTGQRTQALTHIAGRRQVSRMAVALRDVTNENGRYAAAMEATADPADTMARYQKEMDIYLRSSPQGFKILTTQIKNYATEIGQQLIPSLLAALGMIRNWVRAFAELDPQLRATIVSLVLLLAVVGPLVRYLGAFVLLGSQFIKFFGTMGKMLVGVVGIFGMMASGIGRFGTALAWVWREVLVGFASLLWKVFGGIWITTFTAASRVFGLFANIVYTALANIGIAMAHLVRAYLAPMALAFLNHMRMIAFASGTTLLGAVIPALASTGRALVGWAATTVASSLAAIASFAQVRITAAALFLVTLPAWLRTAAVAFGTFVAGTVSSLFGIFIPALSAAGTAMWTFGGAALWRLLTVPGAITIAMLNMAHALRPIALTIAAAFTGMVSSVIASIGTGLIPALTTATVATATWAAQTVASAWVAAQAWLMTVVPALGTMARTAVFQLGLAYQAVVAWAASVVASTALATRAFLVHVGTGIVAGLGALVRALAIAGGAAIAWSGKMVVAAATASAAWLVGLLPKLIAGIAAIPKILAAVWVVIKGFLLRAGAAILTTLTGPWGLAIAAVVGLLYLFRDEVGKAVDWVISRWNDLPQGIANAMQGVIDVVVSAARVVMDIIRRMMNPFGGGSSPSVPSVGAPKVEARAGGGPVKAGNQYLVGEQGPELWTAQKSGTIIPAGATAAMKAGSAAQSSFGSATSGARSSMEAAETAQLRSEVTAAAPGAGPSFDAVIASLSELRGVLATVERDMEAQERVVESWQVKLDQANDVLDAANDKLSELKDRAAAASDALRDSENVLDNLAAMPITGMREMGDAIWDNEMAQKRLRLEMLKIEEVHGPVDELANKLAALQGDIESLTGQREDLRLSGAGSDVLAGFDQQIDQMNAARDQMMGGAGGGGGPAAEMQALKDEMEKLRREGEMLDLERSLEFDPLTRQIERLVDGYEEMPFAEIVAAIGIQQQEVAKLAEEYKKAEQAVKDQEKVVDEATKARDAIEMSFDLETEKLEALDDLFKSITDQIREMEEELQGFAALAASAAAAAGGAGAGAGAGAGGGAGAGAGAGAESFGDFDIPGGMAGLGREEGNIDDLIAEWANEDMFQDVFGEFDLFAPLRERWEQFREWFGGKWDQFTSWFSGLSFGGGEGLFDSIKLQWENFIGLFQEGGFLREFWTNLTSAVDPFLTSISNVIETLSGPFSEAWGIVSGAVMEVVEIIKTNWDALWNNIGGEEGSFQMAFANIGAFLGTALEWLGLAFEGIALAFAYAWDLVVPIFTAVWDVIVGVIDGFVIFFRGIIEVIVGLLAGDWTAMWEGAKTMLEGIWTTITTIISGAIEIVKGIFTALWEFIKDIFTTIYDWLVGNSIIPDLVNAIVEWFTSLWESAVEIWNGIKSAITEPIQAVWDWLVETWNTITTFLSEKWGEIVTAASTVWTDIKASWTAVGEWFSENVTEPIQTMRDTLAGLWESIRETASEKWGAIKGVVRGAANGVIGSINGIIRAWNGLEFSMPSKTISVFGEDFTVGGFSIGTPNIPQIPRLASGGLITQPTIALMGETSAARPEIVSPERLMRSIVREEVKASGSDNGKTNNFYGDLSFPNVKDGDDAESFIRNLESIS